MPVPSRDSAQALPSLSDYGRALWRHRAVVGIAVLVGALVGVAALPHLASRPEYQVTQRVDVKSLTADRLLGPQGQLSQTRAKATAGSTQTQATPLDPSLVPDIEALEKVLNRSGSQFGRLEVLHGVKRSLWLGTVAKNLVAISVPGTTQIDVSITDPDPQLAADLVGGYVVAYADRRNAVDVAQTRVGVGKLSRLLAQARVDVNSLATQAQDETNRSPTHSASQTTASQLNSAQANFTNLQNQINEVTRAQSLQGLPTVVLGQPTVTQPGRRPGMTLFTVTGILLGLLIGVAIALVVDALRPKLVTVEDVEEATGLRVAGSVPAKATGADSLAVQDRPLGPTAEGFHWMRTSLERQGVGRDCNVVAVISAEGEEGRSTVAANLALSLARQGRTAVLVSADLRGGGAEKLFGIPPTAAGLADIVEGNGSETVATLLLWSVGESLWVLPPGRPTSSPAELLASPRFQHAIAKLRETGSIIILDTPPATWSADALLVAGAADGTILVTRSGRTRRQVAAEMVEDLRAEGLMPLGVVLLGTRRPVRRVRQHLKKVSSSIPAGKAYLPTAVEWSSVAGDGEPGRAGAAKENGQAELTENSAKKLID